MSTLNRLTTLGVGAGFVLVGCVNPTDETGDPMMEQAQGITAETAESPSDPSNEALDEGVRATQPDDAMAAAFEAAEADPDALAPPEEQSEEGVTGSTSEAIILGPWGGGAWRGGVGGWRVSVGGWGGGLGGWGGGLWRGGTMGGVPGYGFGGPGFVGPGYGGAGFGFGRPGWGGAGLGGCGAWGCTGGMWW